MTSSSHRPIPVPERGRAGAAGARAPWTCCLRSDLIASLVSAAGLSIGWTW